MESITIERVQYIFDLKCIVICIGLAHAYRFQKMDVIRTDTLALLSFRTYTIHIANGFPISQWYTEKKKLFMNTMETRGKQKIQIY